MVQEAHFRKLLPIAQTFFRSRSFRRLGVIVTGLNDTKLARLEFDATISCLAVAV